MNVFVFMQFEFACIPISAVTFGPGVNFSGKKVTALQSPKVPIRLQYDCVFLLLPEWFASPLQGYLRLYTWLGRCSVKMCVLLKNATQ